VAQNNGLEIVIELNGIEISHRNLKKKDSIEHFCCAIRTWNFWDP
jgi:hypothetical protein